MRVLLGLLSRQTQEEVVEEGRELVADQDPVLVDQVVGGDVGVGPAESLLQRVPLKGRHDVMLCRFTRFRRRTFSKICFIFFYNSVARV